MEPTIVQATELIRRRMAEIDEERKQLEKSLSALTSGGRGATRARRVRTRAETTGRRKIARPGERRRQLLAHLEKHPGAKPVDIAKAIRTTPANVHNLLRNARQDKLVKKQRRGYGLTSTARSGSAAKTQQ
jgi:hypothetical protein